MKRGFFAMLLIGLLSSAIITTAEDTLETQVVENYANIAYASYEDSLITALDLQVAIDDFLATPSEETMQAAKDAWLAARVPYGQTEAYRFYGGPIDDENGPEGLINAWPMDEVYVDYVEGAPDGGIINNVADYPELTAELIEGLNEQGAEENIATGYHAIEFLLWGQDLYEDSAGRREFTDYTTASNADRRGQYLKVVTDLLIGHLEYLNDAWSPDVADNYRAEFLALDSREAIGLILIGAGTLSSSELPGERMFTAYDNQDQEDEHSCFSDNTHVDIAANFQGIANVYFGTYTRVDGTFIEGAGVQTVIALQDADLAASMDALFAEVETGIAEIYTPFDQAITLEEYRPTVLAATDLIFDLGDTFSEAIAVLGIQL